MMRIALVRSSGSGNLIEPGPEMTGGGRTCDPEGTPAAG